MEVDRMDVVVWQDREVKFDIYNVYVNWDMCLFRYFFVKLLLSNLYEYLSTVDTIKFAAVKRS